MLYYIIQKENRKKPCRSRIDRLYLVHVTTRKQGAGMTMRTHDNYVMCLCQLTRTYQLCKLQYQSTINQHICSTVASLLRCQILDLRPFVVIPLLFFRSYREHTIQPYLHHVRQSHTVPLFSTFHTTHDRIYLAETRYPYAILAMLQQIFKVHPCYFLHWYYLYR